MGDALLHHYCCQPDLTAECVEYVALLLEKGHVTSVDCRYGTSGATPLWNLVKTNAPNKRMAESLARLLLDKGADANAVDFVLREPPLHVAAANGHLNMVSLLIEMGAEIDHLDERGRNVFHKLCYTEEGLAADENQDSEASTEAEPDKDPDLVTQIVPFFVREKRRSKSFRGAAQTVYTQNNMVSAFQQEIQEPTSVQIGRFLSKYEEAQDLWHEQDEDGHNACWYANALGHRRFTKFLEEELQSTPLSFTKEELLNQAASQKTKSPKKKKGKKGGKKKGKK